MSEQLFQIGIKAVIRNDRGEVLLQAFQNKDGSIDMWDLPGGRMDEDETFLQTLRRELKEEIAIEYKGEPKLLMTMLSNVKIPVGDRKYPLVIMAYDVTLPKFTTPAAAEEDSLIAWETPVKAAELLATKFPPEFCTAIAKL